MKDKALKAKIIGTGSYLPKNVLTNKDLEKIVDTSDEWIVSRTGIRERRIAQDESNSEMGVKAAFLAIEDAKIAKEEIDLILVATLTPDYICPSMACLIQKGLGLKEIPAMDVQAACSGYIYCLSMAKAFVEQKMYKNVLIVATEKLSSIVNYKDRSTCILFGDGAASCVVSAKKEGFSIEEVLLGADGEQAELLLLPAGGSKKPASQKTVEEGLHYLQMSGNEVFKHAVRRMELASKQCLEKSNISEKEIDWLIPHQANERIIEAIAKRFSHLPKDRVYKEVVQKFGNTSASSVGIALDLLKKEKRIQNKEKILMTVFGAGFTWGACILVNEENS